MTQNKIGVTTTVPVEAIFAAGFKPVDLNNLFITNEDRPGLIEKAEIAGFPSTTCGWIKGIYSAAKEAGIDRVVGVTGGDCSNTRALVEIWEFMGVGTIPFAYPHDRDREKLKVEIQNLCHRLGTTLEAAEAEKARLDGARRLAAEVDRLTWEENKVTGAENHLHLVSASDFNSDPELYSTELEGFIEEANARKPIDDEVRLGYVGVPSVYDGLYDFLEEHGARVVFNETQRQFSLPYFDRGLVDAYLAYTYPYDVFSRIEDIRAEIKRRKIDGIIHYVQSFCFRQMEDMILRKSLGVPVLTIEGDRPSPLDGRIKTRLESFVEMLSDVDF
jgi:benzoyl-CoA reductase/2-hydroxyglutaryl-CoA dehydratase subunit BcrC/BadD/HgdB